MSCYLVDEKTIAMIAAYAFHNDLLNYGCCYDNKHNYSTLAETVSVLARANIDSVNHRYGDNDDTQADLDYIAECIDQAEKFVFHHLQQIPHVDLAKTLNCYSYQACEPDDYFDSDAFNIITVCREQILRKLPGYENASGWR